MKKLFSFTLLFVILANAIAQQKKDSLSEKIDCWSLDEYYTTVNSIKPDTSIREFQLFNPAVKNSYLNAGLGNAGLAIMPVLYFDRSVHDFFFIESLYPYMYTPENIMYFNTRKPFTNVFYANGGTKAQKEQMFEVLHTQNLGKFLNAGVRYRLIHSLGQFARQESKNNHLSLWMSYIRTRYSLHANFNYNHLKIYENGGIKSDSLYESGNYQSTQYVPVYLEEAKSSVRVHSLVISQKFSFGTTITDSLKKKTFTPSSDLYYVFKAQRFTKSYYDDSPDTAYYTHFYLDSALTADSVSFESFENSLEWKIKPVNVKKLGIKTAIRFSNVYEKIRNYGTKSLLNSSSAGVHALLNLPVNIFWNLYGNYCFNGFRSGDYRIRSVIGNLPRRNDSITIILNLEINKQKPPVYYQNYISNHYQWNNHFKEPLSAMAGLVFFIPKLHFSFILKGVAKTDFIYPDTAGLPAQSNYRLGLFAATLSKDFHLGHFHSVTRLTYQASDNNIIRVPDFSWYNSLFFQGFLKKNVLLAQFGFDIFYYSSFMGYSYIPATGLFYPQDKVRTGNYPYLDVFVNLKLRSVRLFARFEHVNYGMMNSDAYSLVHYPAGSRSFKFGLSWLFYN